MRKPEFTPVNEDFRIKRNAEISLLRPPELLFVVEQLELIHKQGAAYTPGEIVAVFA